MLRIGQARSIGKLDVPVQAVLIATAPGGCDIKLPEIIAETTAS
jgi:hypothetical protein